MLWSHMISHVMELIWSKQFYIITYSKGDPFLIIHHLTYLTFLVNLFNQHFELIFEINLFNQAILN